MQFIINSSFELAGMQCVELRISIVLDDTCSCVNHNVNFYMYVELGANETAVHARIQKCKR